MLDSYRSLWKETQCRNEASDDRHSTGNCKGLVMRFKALCSQIRAYTKEFFIFFIISLTVLAALNHEQLLTRRTPSPTKLFSSDLFIDDYENGSLTTLINHVLSSDLSFIMYYAPWDAECVRFKPEYEVVARHFHHQISFAAINCWWPEGECRQKTLLQRFPSLTAYVQNAGEIGYNGPLVASYIISFLDNIVSPFVPLQEEGQLLDLVSRHDGVVVGYFDFHESPHPSGYDVFFRAAMKSLIDDPWRRVKFAVISSRKVAHKLKIDKPVSITLYSWNSDPKTRLNLHSPESVVKWIYKTLSESVVNWVTPSGHKSDSFISNFSYGDSFVLLTPRSLILGSSPYYDILREVAMDFYNCDNSPHVKSLIMRSILNRRAMEEKLMEMEEKCHEILSPDIDLTDSPFSSSGRSYDVIAEDSCCHSQIIGWRPSGKSLEKKCYCTACVKIDLSKCPSGCTKFNCLATSGRYLNSFEPSEANKTASFCNEIKSSYHPKYSPHYKIEVTCSGNIPVAVSRPTNFPRLSMSDEPVSNSKDERIESMMKSFEDRYCARLSVGLNYSEFNFPDSGEGSSNLASQKWRTNFTGIGCRSKSKLKFLAVDSILLPDLAESFGVNIFNETHATAAFIVEPAKKSVYLLNHQSASTCCSSITINKRSMYEMIKNYTEEKLDRFLRSSSSTPVSSSENCLHYNRSEKIICVPEISSSTFNEIVLSPEKDCVLFYYTPWCGYCSSIAHIYLTLAKVFQNDNRIVFARINNDVNDIAFEFDVDKYPTISFFPAGKFKHQMKIFPSSNAITLPNLMKFVLKNAQMSVRLKILFETCDLDCLIKEWFAYQNRYYSVHRNLRNDLLKLTFLRLKIMSKRRSKSDPLKPSLKIFAQRLRKNRFSLSILPVVKLVLYEKLANYVPSTILEPETRKIIINAIRGLKFSKRNRRTKKKSYTTHHEEL